MICKTTDAVAIIQNRTPPAMHILPPGPLRVKFSQDTKDLSGDYMHAGGWVFIHADNTCEINLVDIYERKEVKADQVDRIEVKDAETLAGKYVAKMRKSTSKNFLKKLG